MILYGIAPDGSTVSIDVTEPRLREDQMCVGKCTVPPWGGTIAPECTLPLNHTGRWHIADTGKEIIAVWEVISQEFLEYHDEFQ